MVQNWSMTDWGWTHENVSILTDPKMQVLDWPAKIFCWQGAFHESFDALPSVSPTLSGRYWNCLSECKNTDCTVQRSSSRGKLRPIQIHLVCPIDWVHFATTMVMNDDSLNSWQQHKLQTKNLMANVSCLSEQLSNFVSTLTVTEQLKNNCWWKKSCMNWFDKFNI